MVVTELIPSEGCRPMYAQLYIYDPEFALDAHMQHNDGLCCCMMEKLQNVLLTHHWYAPLFCHAHELLMQEPEDSLTSGIYPVTIRDIYVLFRIYFGMDSQKGTDSSKTKISRSVIYPDNFSDYPNYL